MSRPVRWQVRVSPEVDAILIAAARTHPSGRFTAAFLGGLDRLARSGTRASGVKKLKSLDLWEIRVGDYRAFFCAVPGTDQLALGALEVKKAKRLRMEKLRVIERKVHRWRDTLETER